MDNLFDVMADITNPQAKRLRPIVGKYSMQLDIDGVLVDVTYDVEGWNTPATENDPAEAEYVEIRTAKVGTVDVSTLKKGATATTTSEGEAGTWVPLGFLVIRSEK